MPYACSFNRFEVYLINGAAYHSVRFGEANLRQVFECLFRRAGKRTRCEGEAEWEYQEVHDDSL